MCATWSPKPNRLRRPTSLSAHHRRIRRGTFRSRRCNHNRVRICGNYSLGDSAIRPRDSRYFNRARLYEALRNLRQKRKHIDAHHIGQSFLNYPKFPTTFEACRPKRSAGLRRAYRRVLSLSERWRRGYGRHRDLRHGSRERKEGHHRGHIHGWNVAHPHQPMTDAEFGDYKAHPDAYFGKIL